MTKQVLLSERGGTRLHPSLRPFTLFESLLLQSTFMRTLGTVRALIDLFLNWFSSFDYLTNNGLLNEYGVL